MKSRNEELKKAETKKPRFKIEKLEERIAPARGGKPDFPGYYGKCRHFRC